jgi:hypothetical protein
MHEWGDEWFERYGNDLNNAIDYCTNFWRKFGRIGAHSKEKYGTFRDEMTCGMWNGGLHSLIWPGYVWIRCPFIYWKLDKYIIRPFTKNTGIYKIGLWYQSQIYNYAIQKVCKKYPDIIEEIIVDLDGYEMIKPGIFGKVSGIEIHNKHWEISS